MTTRKNHLLDIHIYLKYSSVYMVRILLKCHWLILSVACLAGCMANNALQYDSVATNNLYHLARVRKGMNETQVLQIMRQPYDYETFELGEDIYDVWFSSHPPNRFSPIEDGCSKSNPALFLKMAF